MKLKILYDSNTRNGFKSGWGFSCLIETSNENILFDTGWNGNILIHNMKIAPIRPVEINKIVISHSDWDHIGGLNHILEYGGNPDIYIPKSVSNNLKNEISRYGNVIEISEAQKICEDVFTTGELGKKKKEQSLVVNTENGNVILTGCAHPGLETIIRKSRELGEIYAVVGGFHDSKIDILKKIPLAIPCHCTRKKGEIKKISKFYKKCGAGYIYKF
jgi:7,8-dihydropterin-6-yl-methyl-4-(beta-D-ribofuranosyl)aminobenzene 5'-phosphate synthase